MTHMFDNDRYRNLRLFYGCKGDEPSMITMFFSHFGFVIIVFQGDDLCGSSFPCNADNVLLGLFGSAFGHHSR